MSRAPRIRACYSDDYCVPTRSRSLEKLGAVAAAVRAEDLAELVDPGVIGIDRLTALHEAGYVRAFLDGERPLAGSQNLPWSPALRSAVLAMQAGQLTAADLARADGIAGHIANGFHHALPGRGGGFCTFNGLALLASAHPQWRVFVLDCDEHGGNGTEAFTERLGNLFNYSLFGTPFGCAGGERSVAHRVPPLADGFGPYREALEAAFARVRAWQPDLLVYQAGADCHADDPMSSVGLTTEALYVRDRTVFSFALREGIPILFTLAGSYQALEHTAALHRNTFAAAAAALADARNPCVA